MRPNPCIDLHRSLGVAVFFVLALVLGGCRVVKEAEKLPVGALTAVVPGSKSHLFDLAVIQLEVQRYSDDFGSRTTAALDEYALRVGTPEARREALRWKISANATALGIATGPNPLANLLDFVAQATITRVALENHWIKTTNGAAFQAWLDTARLLEADAWKVVNGLLTSDQQTAIKDAVREWADSHAVTSMGFFMRPAAEFTSLLRRGGEKAEKSGSLFGLVGLDPTESLEPAVREVTRTRMFAERAMFLAQRMPFLLRWQVEMTSDQLLGNEEVASTMNSVQRLSRAAETTSRTVAQLPDRVTAERKALLEALEAQEGKLRALSAEVTRTLTAGGAMAGSLDAMLKTFDSLMRRFGVGQTNAAPSTPDPNARPFDILDYAKTAEQLTAMSKELNGILKELNTTLDSPALDARLQAVNRISDHATARVRGLIYLAFGLAAALLVLALGCACVYRSRRFPAVPQA